MKAFWIQTKSTFDSKQTFRNDGSGYLLWDAVAVGDDTSGLRLCVENELKERGLTMVKFDSEEVAVEYRENIIPEREEAMYNAVRCAAFSAVTSSEKRGFYLDWSIWTMTEAEWCRYHEPNKQDVWKLVIKTKVSPLSSTAFDGSKYHYRKLLVPADSQGEAESIARQCEKDDFAEIEEILHCSIWSDDDDWFDLYDFSEADSKSINSILNHGKVRYLESASGESLEWQMEHLRERRFQD